MSLANDPPPYTRPNYDANGDFEYDKNWFAGNNKQVLTKPSNIDDCKKIVIYVIQTCVKGRCLVIYIYQNNTKTRTIEELYNALLIHCKKDYHLFARDS